MEDQPKIRAVVAQNFLGMVRALPAEQSTRIVSLIPRSATNIPLVDTTPRLSWIPFEVQLAQLEAARKVLGSDGFRKFHGRVTMVYLEQPLFRSVIQGAVKVFGGGGVTLL